MAIYGPQDAMRHEHRDQLQELVVVRGFDDEFDRHFYVKTMRADLRPPKSSRSSPGQLFLESAKTQQQVADAGSRYWATVHMAGTGPQGPYVVLDYYPRSASDFVEKKVPLSIRSLHRIISGVVEGLIDLQRVADRPHGNLKSSNVLMGPGELERAEVALADPAPLEQLATQGRGDAYDLGQLIHCLVLHRRFTGSWPIEASAGWTSLGSRARGWRELCNRLLNPNPDKRPRLRQIRADLVKLQPSRNTVPRIAIGTALGTFVLATGAAFYVYDPLDLRRPAGGTQSVTIPSPEGPTTAPVAAAAPPTQMASTDTTTPEATAAADAAPDIVSSVQPAEEVVAPPAMQLPEAQVAQIREAQRAFAAREWYGAASYLQALNARLTGSETNAQTSDLQDLETAAALTSQIEKDWAAVSQMREVLRRVDDRMVQSYGAAVEHAAAPARTAGTAESLRTLAEGLSELAGDADWAKVVAFVQSPRFKELDLVYFTQASEAYRDFGENAVASAKDLRAWLRDAESGAYARLDPNQDPRREWAAAARLQRLRESELPRLVKLGPSNGADPQVAKVQEQLQSVEAGIASLRTEELAWDRRNDERIRSGVREVDQTLAQLENELKQAIAQRQSEAAVASARAKQEAENAQRRAAATAFVDQLKGTDVSTIPAIRKEWQAHVDAVTSAVNKDPLQLQDETREAMAELQQRLRTLDEAHSALAAPMTLRPDMPQWRQDLVRRIDVAANTRRESFLSDALAVARAQPSAEKWQERLNELVDGYAEWMDESRALLSDVGDLQSMLAAGYTPDEKPDAKSPAPREVLARIEEHPLWQDERVRAAVEPLVRPLAAAAESSGWQALLKTAETETVPLGVRVAVWERLASSTSAPWPANQADLTQNLRLEEALRAAVKQGVLEPNRVRQLAGRLERSGRRNWERFLTRASSQPDLELALRLKDRYVGTDITSLDRRSQFNVLLHDLRRLLVEADKDASKKKALQAQIARVEQALAALPPELSGRPDVAPLASAIRGYRAGDTRFDEKKLAPMSSLARGPGAIPWTYSYDAQAQTLTCVAGLSRDLTDNPPEIVFKRVEGDGETPPFYLSTTEVSVGLFGDIINATRSSAHFQGLLAGAGPRGRDQRVGPRSWYWQPWVSGTVLTKTLKWLTGQSPHYAPALRDSMNGTLLKDKHLNPSNRHPMQYVSPSAAKAFAELLGCRLQTPQEWRLASQSFPTERPNLRDQTWQIQYQWAADARANRYLPDRGIFVPSNEAPSRDVWTEGQLAGRGRSAGDRAYNDGVLFFHQVAPNGGQSFNHLVGNVAEYAFVGDRLYVVGASALSPPAPVRAVEQAYEVANWSRDSNEGYSDVGFRLAFTAPPAPYEQLRVAVEKQPYLVAASPTTRPIAATE